MTTDTIEKGPSRFLFCGRIELNVSHYKCQLTSWDSNMLIFCVVPVMLQLSKQYLKGKWQTSRRLFQFHSKQSLLNSLYHFGYLKRPERESRNPSTLLIHWVWVQNLESFLETMHLPRNSVLYRLSLWISQVSRHLGITEKSNERTGTSTVRLRDMHMAKLMSSGALETKQEKKGKIQFCWKEMAGRNMKIR